jgi:hypothetical protein
MSSGPDKPRSTYEVGYGRPPKDHRFKSGQSGNPAGRPRRKQTPVAAVEEALHEQVRVHENGRKRTFSALQVITRQVRTSAMRGHLPSAKYLLSQVPKDKVPEVPKVPEVRYDLTVLSDEELEQLERIVSKAQARNEL